MLEIKVQELVSGSNVKQRVSEAYSEPSPTSKMELFLVEG